MSDSDSSASSEEAVRKEPQDEEEHTVKTLLSTRKVAATNEKKRKASEDLSAVVPKKGRNALEEVLSADSGKRLKESRVEYGHWANLAAEILNQTATLQMIATVMANPVQGDMSSADKTLSQSSADNSFPQSSADNNFLQSPADQTDPHDIVFLSDVESSQMSNSHNTRNVHRETQRQTKGKGKELSEDIQLAEIVLKLKARIYKPVLIFASSAMLSVWGREIAEFSPFFIMRNFNGSPRSSTLAKKKAMLSTSTRALLEYIQIISDIPSAKLHIQDVNLRDALNSAVQDFSNVDSNRGKG
ncbi:cytochrome P450 monooxygenase [Physcia stellaris]|nr:cytochrome P450 monooxygenase [Physcia stellaris]